MVNNNEIEYFLPDTTRDTNIGSNSNLNIDHVTPFY